jgi:putative membrane protein insertion efficiency factor
VTRQSVLKKTANKESISMLYFGREKYNTKLSHTPNSNQISRKLGIKYQVSSFAVSFLKLIMLTLLAAYRTIGTTFLGGSCRYYPSCSEYAVGCVHEHRPMAALKLITSRLLRCRPGGGAGYDPVPKKESYT